MGPGSTWSLGCSRGWRKRPFCRRRSRYCARDTLNARSPQGAEGLAAGVGRLRPSVGSDGGWGRRVLDQGEPHLVWLFRKQFMEYSKHTQKQNSPPSLTSYQTLGPMSQGLQSKESPHRCAGQQAQGHEGQVGEWRHSPRCPPGSKGTCLPLYPFAKRLQWSRVQEELRPLTALENDHPMPPTPCGSTGCSSRPKVGCAGCTVG